MVQIANGDGVVVVDTPPLFVEGGRQANPFLDRTQQAALAGALARLDSPAGRARDSTRAGAASGACSRHVRRGASGLER